MLINDIKHTTIKRTGTVARALICVFLLMPLWATGALAQTDGGPYEQARAVYSEGDYSKAAELFAAIAQNDTLDLERRKEALRYLGRAYVAQSLMDEARKAVADLLDLEPPLVELDPDMEPPTLINLYLEERQKKSGGFAVATEDPGVRTLAVMDFRNYAFDDAERWDNMQWGFSSMMIEQLSGATDLKLVERENLKYLLDELDLQNSGRVDQATAVRMGKMLGAHAMVFGGIIVSGRTMTLSARVVKVETSEILLGESVEGKAKDFYSLVEQLSLKVARSVNSALTDTEIGARTETRSLDAMQAYAAGLKLAEDGQYHAAYEKYMEALDRDPDYAKARRRAEGLVPILAALTNPTGLDTGSE